MNESIKITDQERENFPKKFGWMFKNLQKINYGIPPKVLEVLAAIMVMEREDPTKLVELMKEMSND